MTRCCSVGVEGIRLSLGLSRDNACVRKLSLCICLNAVQGNGRIPGVSLLASFLKKSRLTPHLALGERGEKLAERFLRERGYKILVRRYKGRHGEIDLVCRDDDILVFVEVKTRASEEYGAPSVAVDAEKQKNLTRTALEYLREIGNPEVQFRFDIVEVVMADKREASEIRLIQDAFTMSKGYRY